MTSSWTTRIVALGLLPVVNLLSGPVDLAVPSSAPLTAPVTAPEPRTLFSYDSESWVGGGQSKTFKPSDTTTIEITGTKLGVSFSVRRKSSRWFGSFSPGAGDVLRPGTFLRAERDPFKTGRSPGLDVSGDGRGCNEVYGEFTVNQVAFDDRGALQMLDLTFKQRCEEPDAGVLSGTVLFNQLPLSLRAAWKGDGIDVHETYLNSTSLFTLSGDRDYAAAGISGRRSDWSIRIQAPTGREFVEGVTYDTLRFPDDTHAGLDISNGSGCAASTGTLTINTIHTRSDGSIANLRFSFEHVCDGDDVVLSGTLRFLA